MRFLSNRCLSSFPSVFIEIKTKRNTIPHVSNLRLAQLCTVKACSTIMNYSISNIGGAESCFPYCIPIFFIRTTLGVRSGKSRKNQAIFGHLMASFSIYLIFFISIRVILRQIGKIGRKLWPSQIILKWKFQFLHFPYFPIPIRVISAVIIGIGLALNHSMQYVQHFIIK